MTAGVPNTSRGAFASSTAVFGVPSVDDHFTDTVAGGLRAVERRLREAVSSEDAVLNATARHLADAGGKRFRPLMTLMSAHLGTHPDRPQVVDAAVVVELTHLATLYHDDVMDEAAMRRGAPSANERWGNTVAILTGDFLFARAAEVVADLGPECVRIQARTFARLVTGQLRETLGPGDADPVEHYLEVLADKTGSLIATSGQFGAMLAGAPPQTVELVTRFGEELGTVFQLADDVIDVASDADESGKTPGTDLREGVPTLPSLLARRSTHPADARLVQLLSGPIVDDDDLTEALTLLRAHPAMDAARREVRERSASARAILADLPDGPARAALEQLCDAVVERTG
jgi:heptaprenyl diphosphate synthase